MTAEDVETAIIRPMRAAFPAPTHVRTDPAAREDLLNVYRRSLEGFDRTTLERAWQKAAAGQKYWTWPLPEVVVSAAEHFHALAHPPGSGWDEEKAAGMAEAYVRRYMKTSQAATRAREQGYERELRAYVEAAAHVQAQMICGRSGCGYEHGVLFPGAERDGEAEDEWFRKQKAQAETGSIKISVPNSLIGQWKGHPGKGDRGR